MKKFIIYPLLLVLATASVVLTKVLSKSTAKNNNEKTEPNAKAHGEHQKKLAIGGSIGVRAKKVLNKLDLTKLKHSAVRGQRKKSLNNK